MKLATLKDGTRDGQLAVVARDLKTAHLADGIAPTLQAALNDWAFIAPQLDLLYQALNSGRGHRSFDFDPANCMAPLPRTYLRAAGAAYPSLAERLHKADRSAAPDNWRDEPRIYQGAGDDLQGPRDDILLAYEQWGIDFDAGLAVITDDVAMGATPDQAHQQIRLVMLVNDVALRNLAPDELAKGYGFIQSRPAASYAPVAITPDELGDAWKGGKVHLPLRSTLNGKLAGQPQAGADMAFNFPQLLAHLCQTRNLRAGSIVGAGPVSNKEIKRGHACILEKRALELAADGIAGTPYMLFGDTIRIEMLDENGKSLFGAIEQTVKQSEARKSR
ncbi:fumarylacetoacetate hydrolase family protein [Janthinobacterium agaricidamnosum]|uniref:Fumarylacetoacetate (FAA) hydrolase family protein n=1 Tax=Janthinobacterium agaricidamnosum NBRC 102515 = DSM 9628 TaxID=1349767 RepID=W0V3D6_9BURK|nr:fumarylacetoacetate hydrolase family protein [Janthinobacterium agaricidamnosum]CDG81863.1 fumarylacetoacetate (FAA) hydrolase family protein [Janthinobacterium agaricidamnosum NBRC 102515 = DSM 9628]